MAKTKELQGLENTSQTMSKYHPKGPKKEVVGSQQSKDQRLLQGLTQTGSRSWTNQDTAELIKKKISVNVSPERTINLLHCLNEVKNSSLVEEVQQQLSSGALSTDQLSPAQWSALAFILLSSEKDLHVFDLNKYSASEEVLERLLLLPRAANEALLRDCQLTERSGSPLSSVLSSPSSTLTQLDLSHNKLKDSGVELSTLSPGDSQSSALPHWTKTLHSGASY